MPYIMGGLALAQGIFSAFGASSEAEAQATAAKLQQQQANFKAEWAHAAEQRNQMRAFQANLERNITIEKGANRDRALAELYLDKDFLNKKSTLSKETNATNASFISSMNASNVSSTSGTARALLRQNMAVMESNMVALRANYKNAYKDIQNQQNAQLSQRQFAFQEMSVFLPQTGGIVDSSSSALMNGLIQAGLSSAATFTSASMKAGAKGGMNALQGLQYAFTGVRPQ